MRQSKSMCPGIGHTLCKSKTKKAGKGFEARTVALASGTRHPKVAACPPHVSPDEGRTETPEGSRRGCWTRRKPSVA